MPEAIDHTLAAFDPISLAEMDSVKLLDRVDTKYVFAEKRLEEVLRAMVAEYRILEVEGSRGTRYRSEYFDTDRFKHFFDHHNERTFRSKVRFREYLGSGLCFLEVKRKTGRGRTEKARMQVDLIPGTMTPDQQRFAAEASHLEEPLTHILRNDFLRYTFVHRTRKERLTIDVRLRFISAEGEQDLHGICIAELKQEHGDRRSPFALIMRGMGLRPNSLSKYCIGLMLLRPTIKHNTFKEALLLLQRTRAAA